VGDFSHFEPVVRYLSNSVSLPDDFCHCSPRLNIHEAEKDDYMMMKVRKVLVDGIQKFLDYAIELKEKQPDMFHQIISDYESSTQIRDL
jgi:hypothetical protein